MTERAKPYIGLSGVINPNQQYYVMDQFVRHGLDRDASNEDDRLVALGVKAVHKTQFLDIENKYGPEWYPVGEEAFAEALEDKGIPALRVAQIYFDAAYVSDPAYRDEFVARICKRGKAWLNAIQFDLLPWHNDETILPWLEQVKERTGLTILLQAHGEAMSDLGPREIVRTLGRHAYAFDYLLFDASHGKGERMNPEALKPFLESVYESDSLSRVGMAVAGGLNATVVREDLAGIVERYPDISWDAEGQLHPAQPDGTRPIDMRLAKEYIEASARVLGKIV